MNKLSITRSLARQILTRIAHSGGAHETDSADRGFELYRTPNGRKVFDCDLDLGKKWFSIGCPTPMLSGDG